MWNYRRNGLQLEEVYFDENKTEIGTVTVSWFSPIRDWLEELIWKLS